MASDGPDRRTSGDNRDRPAQRYRAVGLSDVGKRRTANQDTIHIDTDAGVFIQADGMGGHRGGAEASRLAAHIVSAILSRKAAQPPLNEADSASLGDYSRPLARAVRSAVLSADNEITLRGDGSDDTMAGMGSTLDVLVFDGDTALIGHVGDSRVYRFRGEVLSLLTDDHSVVNELKRRYHLTDEQVEEYPFKNRVTHALGYLPDRRVDVIETKTEPGDLYLLCSDGLTGVVGESDIANILSEHRDDFPVACERLVSLANEKGGPDNILVVLVERLG